MVTLKDIAKATGYSLVSIHRAIYHKEGLSDETREKILEAIKEMGYEVNYMASSLKRRPLNIAFVGRQPKKPFDYHYMLAKGVKDSFQQNQGLNIQLKEYYYSGSPSEQEEKQCQILSSLYEQNHLDGVVVMPTNTDSVLQCAVQRLITKHVPVVFCDDSFENMDFLCAVQPSNDRIGRTGAEFLSMVCPPGKILVALGSSNSKGQMQNYQGFASYLKEKAPQHSCIPVENRGEKLLPQDLATLIDEKVVGMYTVRESNTPAICKAKQLAGRKDLRVMGCDLSKENQAFLEQGVLTAIIDMDSYRQGYLAMHALQEHLLKGISPAKTMLTVPPRLVLRSNLEYYRNESSSLEAAPIPPRDIIA